MMPCGDVNARARGIQGRLLSLAALHELGGSRSLAECAAGLVRCGYPPALHGAPSAPELDRLVRSVAAKRIHLLGTWLGRRRDAFRALFEGRDLAVLRAIMRGMAEGAPPAARLRGVHPTALFPPAVLARLAAADSSTVLLRTLTRADHPAATALGGTTGPSGRGDLLDRELGLRIWWALRAVEGARRGGRESQVLAAAIIDEQNLLALLLAAAWGVEADPARVFLPGGRLLRQAAFLEMAQQADPNLRRVALATVFAGTSAGRVLADAGVSLAHIPRSLRAAAIREAQRAGRIAPLGAAPLVEVVLRIEAEAEDLCRIVHGLALEAPPHVSTRGIPAAA